MGPVSGRPESRKSSISAKEIIQNLNDAKSHLNDWRDLAKDCYDFYAGVQWTQEDAAQLEEDGRVPVVFNRVVRTINTVAGVEVQNRQEARYFPRNIMPSSPQQQQGQRDQGMPNPQRDDSGFAEMMNETASWVREQGDFEDEESEAFMDLLICGVGVTEERMDYEENVQGDIVKDRIDPLNFLVDPRAKKRNFADARWVAYAMDMPRKDAIEMFPEAESFDVGTFWSDEDMLVHDKDDEWKYINNYGDEIKDKDTVTVVKYQYCTKEPVHVVATPDGNVVELTHKKFIALKPQMEAFGIKSTRVMKKVYRQCYLAGKQVFDDMSLGCDHFTIQAMTGMRDRNRNTFFGLVAIMLDPQRWANKWLSQIQFILNSNSQGGVFFENDAVDDVERFKYEYARPDGSINLLPGGLNKIKERQPIQYPEGIDRLLNYAISAINEIPGVNLEIAGMANKNQPMGLELMRKDSGITVMATIFDSLRRYRKTDGRVLAYFIREYISDGRLVRVLGEDGYKFIPLIKDKVAFDYDIIVDDAPTSTNTKDKIFYTLSQVIPMALQAGIPVPPEVIDYAPVPYDLAQKWKQMIAQQAEANKPDPGEQMLQEQMKKINLMLAQLQVQQSQADVEKTQSETIKNVSSAKKDKSVADEQEALAMQKFGIINGEHNAKMAEISAEQQRKDLELMLNQYRKMLEVRLDARLRAAKHIGVPSLSTIG